MSSLDWMILKSYLDDSEELSEFSLNYIFILQLSLGQEKDVVWENTIIEGFHAERRQNILLVKLINY